MQDDDPFMLKSFFRSIQLLQVLEGAPGKMVCRFFIAAPAPETGKRLVFKDGSGQTLKTDPVVLDAFYEKRGWRTFGFSVISVELPRMKPFSVSVKGKSALHVTEGMLKQKVRERDELMVDPSIDGRYPKWIEQIEGNSGYSASWVSSLDARPLFSIVVPLYNSPDAFLRDMLDSVLAQTYQRWELVLVNASPENRNMHSVLDDYRDERIRIIGLEGNGGIVSNTNVGIKASVGDYICFLDHDGTLSPDILAEYARVIAEDPVVDLIYCDEDSLSKGGTERFAPRFKPDLNRGLLTANDFVLHLLCVSRHGLDQVELSTDRVSGAQGFDLALKVVEVARSVRHVPWIGYHWRSQEGSSERGRLDSGKPYLAEAGKRSISDHLDRIGAHAKVETSGIFGVYSIKPERDPSEDAALVAIPGKAAALRSLVESFQMCEGFADMTIYYVDSKAQPLGALDADIRSVPASKGASFAERANQGVRASNGDIVILASTDIAFTAEDDLNLLCAGAQMPGVGIVSPRAFFADGLVQHAGLCIHDDGSIGYLNQGFTAEMGGYHGTAQGLCDFSAVDPQCIAFRKSIFEAVGGFDEQFVNPVVACVDLCFKMRDAGFQVRMLPVVSVRTYAPFVENHLGRGFTKGDDIERLWRKWPEEHRRDVLFHPSIDMSASTFRLSMDRGGSRPSELV